MIVAALTAIAFADTDSLCAFQPGDRLALHVHTYDRSVGDPRLYDYEYDVDFVVVTHRGSELVVDMTHSPVIWNGKAESADMHLFSSIHDSTAGQPLRVSVQGSQIVFANAHEHVQYAARDGRISPSQRPHLHDLVERYARDVASPTLGYLCQELPQRRHCVTEVGADLEKTTLWRARRGREDVVLRERSRTLPPTIPSIHAELDMWFAHEDGWPLTWETRVVTIGDELLVTVTSAERRSPPEAPTR